MPHQYVIIFDVLYKRYFEGTLLIFLLLGEPKIVIEQVYDTQSGGHFNGIIMHHKLIILEYYFLYMIHDYILHIKKCVILQKHVNL